MIGLRQRRPPSFCRRSKGNGFYHQLLEGRDTRRCLLFCRFRLCNQQHRFSPPQMFSTSSRWRVVLFGRKIPLQAPYLHCYNNPPHVSVWCKLLGKMQSSCIDWLKRQIVPYQILQMTVLLLALPLYLLVQTLLPQPPVDQY